MYYILNNNGLGRACIHVGTHKHLVAKDYCRETSEIVSGILSDAVQKAPMATTSANALAASKEFLSKELFALDREGILEPLYGDSLVAVMEKFRLLSSPNIRNATLKPSASGGQVDNIIKLKMKSPYAYIQGSIFPWQGSDKVYMFKMSEEGPGSGMDLVKRMQPGIVL